MVVGRDAGPFKPPVSRSKASPKARAKARRTPDLRRFLSDFRTGLGKLKTLTQRMARVPSRARSKPLQPNAASAARAEHKEIMRTLERELRLIEKVAPPAIKDRVMTAFRSKAESAIHMGVPQAYAQLMEAPKLVPAKALRPEQSPAMRSLLIATRAIRSGRLAFLPRKTRVEARKLLQSVFASPRAIYTPRAPRTASAVAQQRVLPMVVQGMMRGYENPEQAKMYIDIIEKARKQPFLSEPKTAPRSEIAATPRSEIAATPSSKTAAGAPLDAPHGEAYSVPAASGGPMPPRPMAAPLAPQATAQMAKDIPVFEGTGATHAYAYEPGEESMRVFTKNDGLATDADVPLAPAGTPGSPMSGKAPAAAGRSTQAVAPTSTSPNTASAGEPTQASSAAGGPLTVTGSLAIEGLPGFIAKTEMRLQGLEAVARKQNG